MNIVEWFYVVMCVGIAWIVLTTPYVVEKNAMLKEKWSAPQREPLSDEERQRISKTYSTRAEQVAFEEGIIFAKILYGIGGGE